MLKLYGGTRSRASIVHWYLEELQVPFEFVVLDMHAGEHLSPVFLALNPMGKVPLIIDGDLTLFESGAILLYLAHKYANLPTAPEERAIYDQWVLFGNATLGPGIFVEATRAKETPRLLGPLNDRLAQQDFMLGETFSVVDVAVGSILCYIPMMLQMDLSEYPAVVDYIRRLMARPAFMRTIANRT